MIELHHCKICKSEMVISLLDRSFYCRNNANDHFYGERFLADTLMKIKIRLTDEGGEKLYISFDYKSNTTEVWSRKLSLRDNDTVKIPIDGTFIPDYSDINKLKSKIKTYLLFS